MRIPDEYLVHEVTVRPLTGTGAYGPVHGDPFQLRCFAAGKRRLVRDRDGAEVLSTLQVLAAPGESKRVPAGSLLEWNGDTTKVIASTEHDDGGLGAPQHTELACE